MMIYEQRRNCSEAIVRGSGLYARDRNPENARTDALPVFLV